MTKTHLYPDCDFTIWFRSVNERNTTEKPIEGRITGKQLHIISLLCLHIVKKNFLKEQFLNGSMVAFIKMDLVYFM